MQSPASPLGRSRGQSGSGPFQQHPVSPRLSRQEPWSHSHHLPPSLEPSHTPQVSDTGTQQGWTEGVRAEGIVTAKVRASTHCGAVGKIPLPGIHEDARPPWMGNPRSQSGLIPSPGGGLEGHEPRQSQGTLVIKRPPCLLSCSSVAVLKFLITFEHGTAHLNFAVGPENDEASTVSPASQPPHHPPLLW